MAKTLSLNLILKVTTVVLIAAYLILFFTHKNSLKAYGKEEKVSIEKGEVISNEILVRMNENSARQLKNSLGQLKSLQAADLSKLDSKSVRELTKVDSFKEVKKVSVKSSNSVSKNIDRWFIVKLNGESKVISTDSSEFTNLESTLKQLGQLEGVESVGFNYVLKAEFTPNDTDYGSQYAPNLISADEAWDLTTGSSSLKIAILDTGVAAVSDLANNIDGTVDYDFTGSPYGVHDAYNHGTHVAGIAAAVINNSTGVAGIAGTSKIMRVKVLSDGGSGSIASVASGIEYAADNGAKVINMSMGANLDCDGSGSGGSNTQLLIDAINYAYNTKDVVVVAAAGNDGMNDVHLPGNCPNVISVGAIDSSNNKASFSNYGTAVDITAPGVSIHSTLNNGGYNSMSGTSMSTPHVAGVVALIRSHYPSYSAAQTISALTSYADQISGTGTYWSNGRVNAYRSVVGLPPAPTGLTVISNSCSDASSGTPEISLQWNPTNAPTVNGYNVYRKYSFQGSYSYIGSVNGVNGVGLVDNASRGIVANANADYKVIAGNVNGAGADSNIVNVSTGNCGGASTPPAPTNLIMTSNTCSGSNASLTISWDSVSGALGYNIYRRYDYQGSFSYLGNVSSPTTSFTDSVATGIVDDANAYYAVVAGNSSGASGYSNSIHTTSANCP